MADHTLSDSDFIAEFERCRFDRQGFPHRSHLRMAWIYVKHLGVTMAVERATAGIRRVAQSHGNEHLYHDTMTRAWVYLVAAAVEDAPGVEDFEEFLARFPQLLDKSYINEFYSAGLLASQWARANWQSPDLKPIAVAPPSQPEPRPPTRMTPRRVTAGGFRAALLAIPTPVAVVASRDGDRIHGTTISSVLPASIDPPWLVLCLRRGSRLMEIVHASGAFGVSFLAATQAGVAAHFADPDRPDGKAQFMGTPHALGTLGMPLISGGPARFECILAHVSSTETQHVICGLVVEAHASGTAILLSGAGRWA